MILDEIVAKKKVRLQQALRQTSRQAMVEQAEASQRPDGESVYQRFAKPGIHLIGEVKKASPSKGLIEPHFDYLRFAQEYERAGISAISVLTEQDYFQGQLSYLQTIAQHVQTPVLRKDFIIDDYMIYEARAAGASMILLIVAILSPQQVFDYLHLAEKLGLAVLVEAHDQQEVKIALDAGAQMIGVNNRNLKNFTVAPQNCLRLRPFIPRNKIMIGESGIKTAADVAALRKAGVNGVLIGETLMRAADKTAKVKELAGEA